MIDRRAIKAAALRIAEQFKPQKIILFGSYAYGKPNEHSDVDFMVLMRGSRAVDECSVDIRAAIKFDFPVDLLVRSARAFERRIAMGDYFLMDIKEKGKVLYEAADKGMGGKSRGGLRHRKSGTARKKVAELR